MSFLTTNKILLFLAKMRGKVAEDKEYDCDHVDNVDVDKLVCPCSCSTYKETFQNLIYYYDSESLNKVQCQKIQGKILLRFL